MTVHRWTLVADAVRTAIDSGALQPGDALPSGTELMAAHGVARQTVQQAMDVLAVEGRIVSIPGGARYVAPARSITRLARTRLSRAERTAGRGAFLTDTAGRSIEVATTISRESADADTAERLALAPGDTVIVRARVMRAEGTTVQLATSHFPATLGVPEIEAPNTGPGGVYARLENAGHILTRFTEEVGARLATAAEATALGLPHGAPVLTITRVAHATIPVECNAIVLAADRYRAVYEWPAN